MDRVRLGRTGLDVSVACLGTGGHSRLGRAYGASFDESVAVVNAAIDNGIDLIDTAAGYGTEEIVGRAINGRRDQLVISTKSHMVRDETKFLDNDFITGTEFAKRVEESLTRLGTDHVDILYVHGVVATQYEYCVKEIVPVIQDLRRQGKIRYIGMSERFYFEPRHDLLKLVVIDDYFDVVMVGLNLVNQTALHEVLPMAKEKDLGTQSIYAVRGKLATADGARELIGEAIRNGEVDPADLDIADPLGFLLTPGVADSLVDACYRYCRHAPGVDTVATGTGNVDHLIDNIRSINRPPLPQEIVDRLGRIFGRVQTVTAD